MLRSPIYSTVINAQAQEIIEWLTNNYQFRTGDWSFKLHEKLNMVDFKLTTCLQAEGFKVPPNASIQNKLGIALIKECRLSIQTLLDAGAELTREGNALIARMKCEALPHLLNNLGTKEAVAPMLFTLGKENVIGTAVSVLISDVLVDILREKNYAEKDIFWLTQFVNCAILVETGYTLPMAILMPLISYVLKSTGMKEQYATLTSQCVLMSTAMLLSPLSWIDIPLALTVGVGSTVASWYGAKSTYQFFKQRFFPDNHTDAQADLTLSLVRVIER